MTHDINNARSLLPSHKSLQLRLPAEIVRTRDKACYRSERGMQIPSGIDYVTALRYYLHPRASGTEF